MQKDIDRDHKNKPLIMVNIDAQVYHLPKTFIYRTKTWPNSPIIQHLAINDMSSFVFPYAKITESEFLFYFKLKSQIRMAMFLIFDYQLNLNR
ncbi:hypothetical protein BpHYR1_051774 [Brachionus plicatilis]|uniref:Uncharacterized protein n=1 Tax=Brachionus plicatilis TaxID=10195 RepID=A0A3M7R6J4_BRAPC|nr:hypothetical protein BpHYR1_051774 [Brachionus plicatilis]